MRTLACALYFVAATAGAAGTLVDRVVTVVDGHAITRSDVETRAQPQLAAAPDAAAREKLRRAALDDLIDEHLIREDAYELRVVIEDRDVDAALDSIATNARLSRDELMKAAQAQGYAPARYRAEVRRQLFEMRWLMQRMNREHKPEGDSNEYFLAERARLISALRARASIEVRP